MAQLNHQEYGLSIINLLEEENKNRVKYLLDNFKDSFDIPLNPNSKSPVNGYYISQTKLKEMLHHLIENQMDGLLINFGAEEPFICPDIRGNKLYIIAQEIKFTGDKDEDLKTVMKRGQTYISQDAPYTQPPVMPSPPVPRIEP